MSVEVNSIVILPDLERGFFRVIKVDSRKGFPDLIHVKKILTRGFGIPEYQTILSCYAYQAMILTKDVLSLIIAGESLKSKEKEVALKSLFLAK